MAGEDLITITKAYYDNLVDNQKFLTALENAGVDNWEGYDNACEEYENG